MINNQPALFVSHGSPMMAVENSKTSRFLKVLGQSLPRPKAIIVFSAHLDLPEDIVITAGRNPKTIHDFYGFPDALYQIQYDAPGSPELAQDIAGRFEQAGLTPKLNRRQSWDHGVWIPLRLMYPAADIPIVQVSINSRLGASHHYIYGKLLASLRAENIMIMGSGGISHNLGEVFSPLPTPNRSNMVKEFTAWVEDKLMTNDVDGLLDYMEEAPHVMFNHPTQEHFLPLIAVLGSCDTDTVEKIHSDIEYDVLALDAYLFS